FRSNRPESQIAQGPESTRQQHPASRAIPANLTSHSPELFPVLPAKAAGCQPHREIPCSFRPAILSSCLSAPAQSPDIAAALAHRLSACLPHTTNACLRASSCSAARRSFLQARHSSPQWQFLSDCFPAAQSRRQRSPTAALPAYPRDTPNSLLAHSQSSPF